ncbi:MAG TPA: hypothetical protein VHM65_06805, partial [Candidatus Lustribacter sp.]|nr:hypothetical protein [Candidatus Lustribacter sp.]
MTIGEQTREHDMTISEQIRADGAGARSGERPSYPSEVDAARWPDIARVPRGLRSRFASRIAQTLTRQAVSRLPMRMVLPGGEVCGGAARDSAPTIVVHDPGHFFARLGDSGLVGFGEAYMAGDWSSPDLAAVLTVMAAQMGSLVPMPLQKLRAMYVVRHPDTE